MFLPESKHFDLPMGHVAPALDRAANVMIEARWARRAADLEGNDLEVTINAWMGCRAACRAALLLLQGRPS